MYSTEKISNLLRLLYESSANPERWDVFVAAMVQVTRASGGFVIALGSNETPVLYSQTGFDEGALRNYQQYFYKRDLVLERFRRAGGSSTGWIGSRQSVLSDREMEGSEFYNDYMRPMNFYHQAGANLGRTGDFPLAGMTLVRSRGAGEFSAETIALLRLVAPHLRQGFLLHEKMSALNAGNAILGKALEASGAACFAVDEGGVVRGRTSAADAVLTEDVELSIRDGRLRVKSFEEDRRFQTILQSACCATGGIFGALGPKQPPGGEMLIVRKTPKKPLRLVLRPVCSEETLMQGRSGALVFVVDADAGTGSRCELLQRLYRLTPSEARLSDLMAEGLDVKSCAERMKITKASARFVLQRVFRKTEVTSQSGLMRLMYRLPVLKAKA